MNNEQTTDRDPWDDIADRVLDDAQAQPAAPIGETCRTVGQAYFDNAARETDIAE